MMVEKLQDMHRNLPANTKPVAQLRNRERAALRRFGKLADHFCELHHGRSRQEMILGDLTDQAFASGQAHNAPDLLLGNVKVARDVANARRPKPHAAADQRTDLLPQGLIGFRHCYFVARQTHPAGVER